MTADIKIVTDVFLKEIYREEFSEKYTLHTNQNLLELLNSTNTKSLFVSLLKNTASLHAEIFMCCFHQIFKTLSAVNIYAILWRLSLKTEDREGAKSIILFFNKYLRIDLCKSLERYYPAKYKKNDWLNSFRKTFIFKLYPMDIKVLETSGINPNAYEYLRLKYLNEGMISLDHQAC